MEKEETNILLIDEEFVPILDTEECMAMKPLIKGFMEYYAENKDKPVEEWLGQKIQEQLPDRKPEEIQAMTKEIITTIEVDETNKASLEKAVVNGRSKESWFALQTKKAVSKMSVEGTVEYLGSLDKALGEANQVLNDTIKTQAHIVNQNPNLDGFIAEQYHAQTFNLNAAATGSEYHAKVLEPAKGERYKKNSVDLIISDKMGNGNVVKRYQSKYCKDAKATKQAFGHGDYRGQQKLVPDGQQADIEIKCTTVIEAPDGTTSNPLSKSRAVQMKEEAQSGNWKELNWNEYKTQDLAIGIGKQAGHAAIQGAAIGVGFDIAKKVWEGEEITGEEIVETALVSGADFGVKAATAGALKVGVEKEIIKAIPKGTPASTIANIAHVAIEDVKVVGKMATGELSLREGIDKIEQTTVATVAGLATMGEGAAIGAAAGAVFGPIGAAVGGFVGGSVGYMAGSKVGETIVKGAQKVRDFVCGAAGAVVDTVKDVGSALFEGVSNFISGIFNFF